MMPSPTRAEYQRWSNESTASLSAMATAAPASSATSERLWSGMARSIRDFSSSGGIATITASTTTVRKYPMRRPR